jgi:hypothetical protein
VTAAFGGGEPQVAWKAIEEGADVVAADGEVAAHVSRIVGDSDADVFTGLAVTVHAFGHERFIPAERVGGIWPRRVEVDLSPAAFGDLPRHEDVPSVRVRPGARGLVGRLFGGRRRP